MEFLKDFLQADTYDKVITELSAHGDKVKLANLASGEYVSKLKYDDDLRVANQTAGELQTALNAKSADYNTLQEKVNGFDAVKSDYEQKLKTAAVVNALVTEYKPRDAKDILRFLDMDKISLENDTLSGLSEQIEPMQSQKSYLFENAESQPNKPLAGGLQHGENTDENLSVLRKSFGLSENKN